MKQKNIFLNICKWLFITSASFVTITACINGDYLLMLMSFFALLFCIISDTILNLLEECEDEREELLKICVELVNENDKLTQTNEAILREQAWKTTEDIKSENLENNNI